MAGICYIRTKEWIGFAGFSNDSDPNSGRVYGVCWITCERKKTNVAANCGAKTRFIAVTNVVMNHRGKSEGCRRSGCAPHGTRVFVQTTQFLFCVCVFLAMLPNELHIHMSHVDLDKIMINRILQCQSVCSMWTLRTNRNATYCRCASSFIRNCVSN